MANPWMVLAIVGLYAGLLFLITLWVERGSRLARRVATSPLVYALTLAVYCTSWSFYGSVGSAATSGVLYLAIYMGPTLTMTLGWFVLRKLVLIKDTQRITSIADLISARYGKAQSLAALATVAAVAAIAPYIALQLKSVSSTFVLIAGGQEALGWAGENMDLLVAAFMALLTILLGLRQSRPTVRHEGMVTALAVQSVVVLVAFLAVGLFCTYGLHDGLGDILDDLPQSADLLGLVGGSLSPYLTWMTYLLLGMSAILFLPHLFHVAVIENAHEGQIKTAVWLLPLYTLLLALFVVPVAMGGLAQGYNVADADTFVLRLPLDNGQPWLAMLVFLGGFAAALGMIVIGAKTTATMLTQHFVLPLFEGTAGWDLVRRHLPQVRWLAAVVMLGLGWVVGQLIGDASSLVDLGLIAMTAALQFAPAALGGIFWRRGNRRGAHLGLGMGLLLWIYTLLLPAMARSGWMATDWLQTGPWGITMLRPEALFGTAGMEPLAHAVVWTLLFNTGLYIVGSLPTDERVSAAHREEARLASAFVDALDPARATRWGAKSERQVILAGKLPVLRRVLEGYYPTEEAGSVLDRALVATNVAGKEQVSVGELVELESEVERVLTGTIGVAAAHRALRQAGLFDANEEEELTAMYGDILTELRVSPNELRERVEIYQERGRLLGRQAEELEGLVAERTRLLEIAAEVARATTEILDPERLMREVVERIRTQFDLYYVGLFLIDETRVWAALQAGTGAAGRAMIERQHRIRVGEGLVGWCISHATARVASTADLEVTPLATPELPETQSEAALPLRSREQVLGALTVQDSRPGAFDKHRLLVLQIVADQVAVALDNARLFTASQKTLEEQRLAYGEASGRTWLQMARARGEWGYFSDYRGVSVSQGDWQPWLDRAMGENRTVVAADEDTTVVAVPVRVRGRVVGALDFSKAQPGRWSDDEVSLIETLVEQLGIALESAQLYADTRLRAARERLLGEVTTRVRETLDIDTVMKTAAVEIREALGLPEVAVRLRPLSPGGETGEAPYPGDTGPSRVTPSFTPDSGRGG